MRCLIKQLALLFSALWAWGLLAGMSTPEASADFVPIYRGGICVADGSGNCVGGDAMAEAGVGVAIGYMKTSADAGTVAVYRGTCYSDTGGSCTGWGLTLEVNGTAVGYLATSAPDAPSANAPFVQSGGLLLQGLGGTASAYLWTTIPPPAISNLSPTSGPVDTPVTISGSHFGTSQGASTVTFNAIAGSPTTWSDTSIAVTVPAAATTGPVVVTVGGLASNGVNFTVSGGGGGSNPTKLVVTAVNGGSNPPAGIGFPVVVEAQDAGGVPRNVTANTGISLSLNTGTGILGGTLTGTITAGSSQVIVNGVTYTRAEGGVVITATRTSGDTLTAGDSGAFAVNPGAATALAFITQPGNAAAGSSLPGPPTVAVQDAFGNTVTSSAAEITVAIGTNPGSGALTGTTNKNASSGIAAFTDLSINSIADGYTLAASTTGLTGATSGAFNIIAGGGTITGTITRVSDGTFVAGAVVEAFQGTVLHGAASTNASGNYSINGLADGTYAVRASASGFVPQVSEGVTIVSSGTVIANLSLNAGIAIHSPVAATVINDHEVLVTGQFDTSLGAELGINVNGYVALQDGDEFAALIPVDAETTSLIATVTNTAGTALGSHTIPVTVQPPTSEQILFFKPSPTIVLISEPVSFTLTSLNPISQIQLDANGDGTTDFTGTTLEGQSVTFAEAGLYFPLVNVTEPGGTVRTATALIQVVDISQLDLLLKSKWNSMKDALRSGNTAEAATYIVLSKRTNYQNIFDNLTVSFASIDQYLTNIIFVRQRGPNVEYKMVRTEGLNQAAYPVFFVLDEDGVWRIKGF